MTNTKSREIYTTTWLHSKLFLITMFTPVAVQTLINLIKWYFSGPVNLEKKKVYLCGTVTRLPEFSWASQLWFPFKTWPKVYIKKWKVGLARRETWLALPGYPFLIVGTNSEQGFLGWNYHCLSIIYVSLMLSDNIITSIRGKTK